MSIFDWCRIGDHEGCRRKYQPITVDPRTNAVVVLDEWRYCECRKRGCGCYVPPAERSKPKKKTRRKK